MPIKLPVLDNKRYDDLMKEMIASIPKYSKEWTNFNPSDPGITLLELLAWVTEGLIYRTNQVPADSYINFLKLVTGPKEINDFYGDTFASLEKLPQGIAFPDPKADKVAYDAANKLLSIKGIMTEKVKNHLLSLSDDGHYRHAVNRLFQDSLKDVAYANLLNHLDLVMENKSQNKTIDIMTMKAEVDQFLSSQYTAVKEEDCRALVLEKFQDVDSIETVHDLEILPAGIQFPPSIRIFYDDVVKKLVFTGVMTESEKAVLLGLAPKDDPYRAAIDALFQSPPIGIKRVEVFPTDHVLKVIIIPEQDQDKTPAFDAIITEVKKLLNQRKLLGSFINVQKALYTDLDLLVNLTCESYATSAIFGKWASYTPQQLQGETGKIEETVANRLFHYLSKLSGGPEGHGWPYGRNLVVYELFHELEKIENVKFVDRISQYVFSLPVAYPVPVIQYRPIESWVNFSTEQFTGAMTVPGLCGAIKSTLSLQVPSYSIDWLNTLLQTNGLYHLVLLSHAGQLPTEALKSLKEKYDSSNTVTNLSFLNRFLLEEYYPQDTPKSLTVDFCAMGHELSKAATIRLIDDNTWEIADGNTVYSLRKIDGEFKVYAPFTEIAIDGLIRLNSLQITIKTKVA